MNYMQRKIITYILLIILFTEALSLLKRRRQFLFLFPEEIRQEFFHGADRQRENFINQN